MGGLPAWFWNPDELDSWNGIVVVGLCSKRVHSRDELVMWDPY
ncbi:hypothetical protein TIFTF001_021515 [Ficus carica]|uniref:Uncharacterized protein n=1 Tax=Ficus carica TaxID=3494 RepID=A0AA88AGV3_FICCA|nr:hypothetical protein TIFTF001_021515 [Ficus carica]